MQRDMTAYDKRIPWRDRVDLIAKLKETAVENRWEESKQCIRCWYLFQPGEEDLRGCPRCCRSFVE